MECASGRATRGGRSCGAPGAVTPSPRSSSRDLDGQAVAVAQMVQKIEDSNGRVLNRLTELEAHVTEQRRQVQNNGVEQLRSLSRLADLFDEKMFPRTQALPDAAQEAAHREKSLATSVEKCLTPLFEIYHRQHADQLDNWMYYQKDQQRVVIDTLKESVSLIKECRAPWLQAAKEQVPQNEVDVQDNVVAAVEHWVGKGVDWRSVRSPRGGVERARSGPFSPRMLKPTMQSLPMKQSPRRTPELADDAGGAAVLNSVMDQPHWKPDQHRAFKPSEDHATTICAQLRKDLAEFRKALVDDIAQTQDISLARVGDGVALQVPAEPPKPDQMILPLNSNLPVGQPKLDQRTELEDDFRLTEEAVDALKDEIVEAVSARNLEMMSLDNSFGSCFGTSHGGLHHEPHYHVEDYYKTTGIAQSLCRNEHWVNFSFFVIVLNAIYIGVDVEVNTEPSLYSCPWPYIVLENAFCTFYTVDIFIRWLAFRQARDAFRDGWFRFDLFLLVLMILETWIFAPVLHALGRQGVGSIQLLRLLRLLRLTRMARLVRHVPELVTLTKGMVAGARAVFASFLMIFLLMYIFAIALHTALKDNDSINDSLWNELGVTFSGLGNAMWILLIMGTFLMDGIGIVLTDLLYHGETTTSIACFILLVFIFLAAMNICNMLIGVLCDVVSEVQRHEKEMIDVRIIKETMLHHLISYDTDGDGMISREELIAALSENDSKKLINTLNVDRSFLLAMAKMMYRKKGVKVSIGGVVELMLLCRGDNHATVQTMAGCLSYLSGSIERVDDKLRLLSTSLDRVTHV